MRHLTPLMTAAAALTPTLTLAHEGEHGGQFLIELGHVLSEPDHLAAVCVLAAAIGAGVWLRRVLRKRAAAGKRAPAASRD
jgi:hydrogenase/urease accessory protein HupE